MKSIHALVAAAALAGGAAAFAHGDEHHPAAARKFDAAKVEPTAFGQEGHPGHVVPGHYEAGMLGKVVVR